MNFNMVKKIFIIAVLLGCTALGATASQWGLLPDFVNETTGAGQQELKVPAQKRFLLHPIVEGRPVYYRINGAKNEKQNQAYQSRIRSFFDIWFTGALEQIRQSGREQEFADIIPILERGVDLRLAATDSEADIIYYFVPLKQIESICGENTAGCLIPDQRPLRLYIPTDKLLFAVMSLGKQSPDSVGIHETGHALGLSDQYILARSENSDIIFSAPSEEESVMNHASSVTCDDVTGLINAIDLVRGTSRGKWNGLCQTDFREYNEGTNYNKVGFRFSAQDYKKITMETYWDGRRIAAKEFGLDLQNNASEFAQYTPASVELADSQNRPLQATTSNGETIYYAYVFDKTIAMVVKNGKIKQFSQDFYNPEAQRAQVLRKRVVFFAKGGQLCGLLGTVYANKSGEVEMLWDMQKDPDLETGFRVGRRLVRAYNAKGELEHNLWQEKPKADFPGIAPAQNPVLGSDYASLVRTVALSEEQKEIIRQADAWFNSLK